MNLKRMLGGLTAFLLASALCGAGSAQDRIVDSYFQNWLGKSGGKSAWRGVKSFFVRAHVENDTKPGEVSTVEGYWLADTRFRSETMRSDSGVTIDSFDGKQGWVHNERLGSGSRRPEELTDELSWTDLFLPITATARFSRHQLLPDETKEGRFCHVVEMFPEKTPNERWYFDVETGLLHARTRMPTLDWPPLTLVFEDYRVVKGKLKLPYRVVALTPSGKVVAQRELVTVNPASTPKTFSPPEEIGRRIAEIDAVLARNLEAIGGLKAAKGIYSRVVLQRVQEAVSGLSYEQKISQRSPYFILAESETPGLGRVLRGFDGRTAWEFSDVQGYHELKGGERASLLGSASLLASAQLRARFSFGKVAGTKEIEGRPAVGLEVASLTGPGGVYWFDRDTGHLARLEGTIAWGAQGSIEARVDFSDYRRVDGVSFPFVTTTTHPAVQSISTVLKVENNVPLDMKMFQPRKDG